MTLRATDYVILKDVQASGRRMIPMERKPVRVATIVSHEKFEASGHLMIHWETVFFEDRMHDWEWRDGQFRYYTRIAESADVLIVYAEEEVPPPPPKFCAQTGAPLGGSQTTGVKS